jgi:branched-chain amino acid transport system ATP-binding protein
MENAEIVSIIGPNGAGKTTLLRTISSLLPVEKGNIIFEGKKITNLPPHMFARLGIAHVPEGRSIFAPLTVHENLLLGSYSKRGRTEAETRGKMFDLTFELFPVLRERRNQKEDAQRGEQQMLAIARGLMSDPKLLLVDEPTLVAPVVIGVLFKSLKRINEKS